MIEKILIYILIAVAIFVGGVFAYNGYKSNQLLERDIELKERLAEKQLEQKQLEKAKAVLEAERRVTKEKKSVNKKSLQETTERTVSEDFEKQAKRLKERLK